MRKTKVLQTRLGRASSIAASPLLTRNVEEAPYFTVKLQYFHKYAMNVPMNFARSNGLVNRNCTVTLKNGIAECWQLNMVHKERSGQVVIHWLKFLDDNKLSMGDVCMFELLSNEKKLVMEVTLIELKNEQHETKMKKRQTSEDLNSSRAATASLFRNATSSPQFTVKILLYNFSQAIMHSPIDFARSKGLIDRICQIALVDKRGIDWQVSLGYKNYQNGSSQVYIRDGWREFSAAERLRIGDKCTFQLISSGNKVVMKVTISRTSTSI